MRNKENILSIVRSLLFFFLSSLVLLHWYIYIEQNLINGISQKGRQLPHKRIQIIRTKNGVLQFVSNQSNWVMSTSIIYIYFYLKKSVDICIPKKLYVNLYLYVQPLKNFKIWNLVNTPHTLSNMSFLLFLFLSPRVLSSYFSLFYLKQNK